MVFFINETGIIGIVLASGAQTVTGDIVSALMLVFIMLIAICLMFNIPLEFTVVILLPLALSMASYYSNFMSLLIVMLIYLATLLAKNWLFK